MRSSWSVAAALALGLISACFAQEPETPNARADQAAVELRQNLERIEGRIEALSREYQVEDSWPFESDIARELSRRAFQIQGDCLEGARRSLSALRAGEIKDLSPEQRRGIEKALRYANDEALFIPEDAAPDVRATLILRELRRAIHERRSKINSIVVQGRALNENDHRIMAKAEDEIRRMQDASPLLLNLARAPSSSTLAPELRETLAEVVALLQGPGPEAPRERSSPSLRESGDAFPPEARRRALELERLALDREKVRLRFQIEEQRARLELFRRRLEIAQIERELSLFERQLAARPHEPEQNGPQLPENHPLAIDLQRTELSFRLSQARLALVEAEQAHLSARIQSLEVLGERE